MTGYAYGMPVRKPTFTSVRARRGKVVHAAGLSNPLKTACDKPIDGRGWIVCREWQLGCEDCKAVIGARRRS